MTATDKLLIPEVNPAYCMPAIADDIAQDIDENRPVLLTGHTGTGKSSMIEQIAAKMKGGKGQQHVRVNANGQISIGDFVGMYIVKDGATEWIDGVLPLCVRNGYWLTIEELDFAEAPILAVTNTLLERNVFKRTLGKLTLKEHGHEIIEPHPDFRLFATANTAGRMSEFRSLYQGTNILNEAFLDRWRVYHVDYLPKDAEVKVLMGTIPDMDQGGAEALVEFADELRDAFKNETLQSPFSTRRLIDFAEMLCRKKEQKAGSEMQMILDAAEVCIISKVQGADGEAIKAMIQQKFGGS